MGIYVADSNYVFHDMCITGGDGNRGRYSNLRLNAMITKANKIADRKPWQRKEWVIPPDQNSSFVANLEMVLDVYKRPFDPQNPVVVWMNPQNN
jgi:hypothetical protein